MIYYCLDYRKLKDGNSVQKDIVKTTDYDFAYQLMECLNAKVLGLGDNFVPDDHIGEDGFAYDVYQITE